MGRRRRVVPNVPLIPLDVIGMIARCSLGAAGVLCRLSKAYYRTVRPIIQDAFLSPVSEYEIRRYIRAEIDRFRVVERPGGCYSSLAPPVTVYRYVSMSERSCSYHVIGLEEGSMSSPSLVTLVHYLYYSVLDRDGKSVVSKYREERIQNILLTGALDTTMMVVGLSGSAALPHISILEQILDRRHGADRRFLVGQYAERVVSRLVVTPMMTRVLCIGDGHMGKMMEAIVLVPHTDQELLVTMLRIGILGIWCSGSTETVVTWFIWPLPYCLNTHTRTRTITTGSAQVRTSILVGSSMVRHAISLVRDTNP